MNPERVNWVWQIIRWVFWIALVVLAGIWFRGDLNLSEVWPVLQQTQSIPLSLALVSVIANNLIKTLRWQVLLNDHGRQVSLRTLWRAIMVGQLLNLFLPGRAGDLSRAVLVGSRSAGKVYVLGTVALEKVIEMLSYAVLFLYALAILRLPNWISDSGLAFTALTLLLCGGVLLLAIYPQQLLGLSERLIAWLPEGWRAPTIRRIEAGLASLGVIQRRSELVWLALLTALVWATALLTNLLVFWALGIDLPWHAALVLLLVLQLGITIPTVPGRVGVFQYLCVLALGLYSVPGEISLGYGILLQAVVFLPVIGFGLVGAGQLNPADIGFRVSPPTGTSQPAQVVAAELPPREVP